MLEKCPNLTSVNFYYCEKIEGEHTSNELSWLFLRTSPHFLTECPPPCVPGVFTGAIIRMISNMRAKHGKNSVNLLGCGEFTLAEDLSDIKDITSIDLSNISSLEGT